MSPLPRFIQSNPGLKETWDSYAIATPPTILNDKDWPESMEAVNKYLCNIYGLIKIPLLNVTDTRQQESLGEGVETEWCDPLIQMINQAPHWILPAAGGINPGV